MPLVAASELNTQYWEPVAQGPVAQADLSASGQLGPGGPPTSIPNASSYQSNVIINAGFRVIALGCTSANTGVITIQRYLDRAGLIPVGAPITANLTAATAQWAIVTADGVPYQSFKFQISNTGAGSAAITNFGLLLGAG